MTSILRWSTLFLALIACGDASPAQPGGGGAGAAGTGGGSAIGGGSASGGGPEGGSGGCTEIALSSFGFAGELYAFSGTISPGLGTEAADTFKLIQREVQHEWPYGQEVLSSSYRDCASCITVGVDHDPVTGHPQKLFFQASGRVDYGSTEAPRSAGTISDVTLVEVLIEEGTATPVPDGACLHIEEASFASALPAAWTCAPEHWAGQDGCDCACGLIDPDCSILADEPVLGCPNEDDRCNGNGECVPLAFRCSTIFYHDGAYCDCGCGVVDPDCADATLASCDYCDNLTSCSENTLCDDPACPIDPENNAVCLPAPM